MGTLADEVALFWGIDYFNTILLQADGDQVGSLNTEILLNKDTDSFTLSNEWAFPQRIYFDGENCIMPPPHTFPALPNGISSLKPTYCKIILLIVFTFITLVTWFWWINYPDRLTSSIFFPRLPNGWWCIICLLLMYMKFYVFMRVFLSYVQERVCTSYHSISLWSML